MQAFRDAMVAIMNADTDVQAVTNRNTGNLIRWSNHKEAPDVAVLYQIVSEPWTQQNHENRMIRVQFSCFGLSLTTAETLAELVRSKLTSAAFRANGIDAVAIDYPGGGDADDLEQGGTFRRRVDVEGIYEARVPGS